MAHSSTSRRIRFESPVSYLTVVGRFLLCLCLWNSPLPLLHAHESVADNQSSQLAQHLRECHWRSGAETCRCWHVHLVLWGEVQSDPSDSSPPPPQPKPVDDNAVPSGELTSSLRQFEDWSPWSLEFVNAESHASLDAICDLSAALRSSRDLLNQLTRTVTQTTVIRC